MTTKEVKEWMMRAKKLSALIKSLTESKVFAYDKVYVKRAKSAASSREKAAALATLQAEVDEQIAALYEVRAEILHIIQGVENTLLATLLTEYYVNDKTWEQVAERLHYSYSQVVKYLHPKALEAVKDAIQCHKEAC